MRLSGLLEPRGGGDTGRPGGRISPQWMYKEVSKLLDAGGLSTAPVAPGRYGFLLEPAGYPSLVMAWGGGQIPGPGWAVWLSWNKVEVAGGHEAVVAAACGALLRNARCHPPLHG